MAVEVRQVFEQAMGLMDELSNTGQAQSTDTKEYEYRVPAIINMLVAELKILLGDAKAWSPVESLDDYIPLADTTYALGAMGYGLAANLWVDENAAAASFFQQRYEEMRSQYVRGRPAAMEEIEPFYGGLEYGQFGRW